MSEGPRNSFSLGFWVQQGHSVSSTQHGGSPSQLPALRPVLLIMLPFMWHRGLCCEVCKLLGFILESHVMVLLLQGSNSCPIYSEFLSLSQLLPLHTLALGLKNWASSQRQSIANLSHSHSASFPPVGGKKCTSCSIHEEIILTIMRLSLLLWFFL